MVGADLSGIFNGYQVTPCRKKVYDQRSSDGAQCAGCGDVLPRREATVGKERILATYIELAIVFKTMANTIDVRHKIRNAQQARVPVGIQPRRDLSLRRRRRYSPCFRVLAPRHPPHAGFDAR